MNYCALLIVDVMVFEFFSKSENEKVPVTTNAKITFQQAVTISFYFDISVNTIILT